MSYTTGTTHYNLPQTTGTDKRDWSDTNQAFQDIDAALYQATQDTAQAALDIEALEVRMDTAEQNIATNAGDIAALDGRVTTVEGTVAQHTTQIGDVRTDLEDMICAYNEASATSTHAYAVGDYFIYNDVLYRAIQTIAVGDTIVPDTNCTTTNVTSEIEKTVVLGTIICDGIKTTQQILNELFRFYVYDTGFEYLIKTVSPTGNVTLKRAQNQNETEINFLEGTFNDSDHLRFNNYLMKNLNSKCHSWDVDANRVLYTDNSSIVETSGKTFSLLRRKLN